MDVFLAVILKFVTALINFQDHIIFFACEACLKTHKMLNNYDQRAQSADCKVLPINLQSLYKMSVTSSVPAGVSLGHVFN